MKEKLATVHIAIKDDWATILCTCKRDNIPF